jgi:hypothetical protein
VRSGCGCGCITIVLLGLLVGALFWLGSGVFERPSIQHEIGTATDGRRAQQKLFELTTRGGGRDRRDERRAAVTLSEPELNALLTRHLSGNELPLDETSIRLVGDGVAEVAGRVPLRAFWGDSLNTLLGLLPERWVTTPVWLRLRGHVQLELGTGRSDQRKLRLDVDYLALGRRRLPTAVLSLLPEGPVLRATRWPVPETVESVTVEPGRLTITTRP